ncbi:MAG: nucleotide exchange factor GrpE [Candidatus Acidiferrales bacterium]
MSSHNDREKDKGKGRGPEIVFSAERAEADAESSDPRPADEAGGAGVSSENQKLLSEKQELMETLVRRQADFENYRKRVEKERQQERHRGAESLVEQLLPVLDAFDRALAGPGEGANAEYRKGFELIRKQLWDALSKQGLKRVESVGQEFNPHFHHAIDTVETSEHADGVVIGELQPGYLFHDRVLRPAMVRVASAPESRSAHAARHDN